MDDEFMFEIDELMNEGKFDAVIEKIRELDEDEMNLELSLILAHALSQCAEYREALDTLKSVEDEAIADDMGYHLETAGAHFGLHHYHAAIEEARKCIEIDETCVEPWLLLCLVYQETGDDVRFDMVSERAKELDEEAWDKIFGDRKDELALFDTSDISLLLDYISNHFGEIQCMIPVLENDEVSGPHPINFLLVKPSSKFNYYKIISIGLGAYKGIENNSDEVKIHRIEMVTFLPPHLSIMEILMDYNWVASIMRQFGEMIQFENSWLGPGHTISYGDNLGDNVEYNGVIFNDAFSICNIDETCVLDDGDELEFLQMIPLYEEEMLYKIQNGVATLFKRMNEKADKDINFIYLERANTCAEISRKKWALPRSAMEELLEWEGGDGCYATDRITVDNRKVGIMYREKPAHPTLDSGWRFLAGDEDEKYMSNIDNMEIFRLNTICNYDPDIIEYLDNPVGSAFYRSKNGEFKPMKMK